MFEFILYFTVGVIQVYQEKLLSTLKPQLIKNKLINLLILKELKIMFGGHGKITMTG